MGPPITALAAAGILGHRRGRLRVHPRFLGFAESIAATHGLDERATLAHALAAWDDFHGDALAAAPLLLEVLAERHQLGLLRPVFPTLESFAAA